MNRSARLRLWMVAIGMAAGAHVLAQQQTATGQAAAQMHGGCGNYATNLSSEMRLMAGEAVKVRAGTDAENAPMEATGRAMEVHLRPQTEVHLAAAPAQDRGGAERKAGLVQLGKLDAGEWRVSLDRFAWVDLVSRGQLLASGAFEMQTECPTIFKTVVFEVPEAMPVVLELTGASEEMVRVVVTRAK